MWDGDSSGDLTGREAFNAYNSLAPHMLVHAAFRKRDRNSNDRLDRAELSVWLRQIRWPADLQASAPPPCPARVLCSSCG